LTEATFLYTSISARSVWPLTERSRLLVRGELGAIQTTTFSDLPPSQRFFAGGDQSVRGYGYQELSPENSDGDAIGGQYLTVASIEADYLIYKNFGMATFIDVGNAGEDVFTSLKTGIGIGLRYRSPVGMIRFDVARPLDDEADSFRLHISIGADL
jgi:translocation and assembly module TamA